MSKSISQHKEEVYEVARQADSYAYRFVLSHEVAEEAENLGIDLSGAELLEVRMFPDATSVLTPCDRTGLPVGTPKSSDPGSSGKGVSQPRRTLRDEIRDEEHASFTAALNDLQSSWEAREQETEEPGVEAPPKKRRWWNLNG